VSNAEWELEPNAEREILLTWLDREPNPDTRERVVEYIAELVRSPFRPQLEDGDSGIFSITAVPGTVVGLTWLLDMDHRQVVLATVG
jgi:hypothetical protein